METFFIFSRQKSKNYLCCTLALLRKRASVLGPFDVGGYPNVFRDLGRSDIRVPFRRHVRRKPRRAFSVCFAAAGSPCTQNTIPTAALRAVSHAVFPFVGYFGKQNVSLWVRASTAVCLRAVRPAAPSPCSCRGGRFLGLTVNPSLFDARCHVAVRALPCSSGARDVRRQAGPTPAGRHSGRGGLMKALRNSIHGAADHQ